MLLKDKVIIVSGIGPGMGRKAGADCGPKKARKWS